MDAFRDSLPMMLYRALDAVMPRFREIFRASGLTEQQWRILRVLWERDEMQSRDLAEVTLIPPPSLVGIVDRLAARGLVRRRRDEHDRRNVLLSITPAGQALKEHVTPAVDAAYRDIREALEPEVFERLQGGLQAVCRIDTPERASPLRRRAANE